MIVLPPHLISTTNSTQAQLLPLRKAVARLTRENNQLHGAVLQARDEGGAALLAQQTEAAELRASLAAARGALAARERELKGERCVDGWMWMVL